MRTYISFTLFYLLVSLVGFNAQAQGNSVDFSGDVSLLSHYVEDGLSQTDKSPALQASFWFAAGPQFRFGLWGSNVNYSNEDDVFNLRASADIKVDFNPRSYMKLTYAKSLYFNDGHRDGDIFGIHLHFLQLKVSYNSFSNWEGIRRRSERFGLEHEYHLTNQWVWKNGVGFNNVDSKRFDDYFDLKTGLGTNWGAIFIEGAVTGTTTPDQFHGTGDVFLTLSASTEL